MIALEQLLQVSNPAAAAAAVAAAAASAVSVSFCHPAATLLL